MEKDRSELVKELIKELIRGDESLIDRYTQYESNSHYNKKDNVKQLEEEYDKFRNLLEEFQENYRQFFKIEIDKDIPRVDKKNVSKYLNIGKLYIDIIQNTYLNPINYRINQLNAEKNNNKARTSIHLGIASVILAVVGIVISFVLQDCANRSGKQTNKQLLDKADSVSVNIDTCKQLLEKTDNVSLKIDSFYFFIKENNKKVPSFGERKDTVEKIRSKTTL